MADICMNDFFKNYTLEEKQKTSKIIEKALKEVNEDNVLEVANKLARNDYNRYPEIQYYRVNLLIRAGKINKAFKVASNYLKFEPLRIIHSELEKQLDLLESKRKNLTEIIASRFVEMCPEVEYETALNEIKNLEYEDVIEISHMIDYVYSNNDIDAILNYSKTPEANRYSFMQYVRIRYLIIKGNEIKAQKILKTLNTPLFITLKNNDIKEAKIVEKEPIKNLIEEVKPIEIIEVENNNLFALEPKKEQVEDELAVDNVEPEEKSNDSLFIPEPKNEELIETQKELSTTRKVSILLTKLHINKLNFKEIEDADIPKFEKDFLKIAFYDKYNNKNLNKFIRDTIKYYKDNNEPDKVKKLSKLDLKIHGKIKRIFDLDYYRRCLNASILDSEIKKLEKEVEKPKQEKIEIPISKPIVEEIHKKEDKPKYITSSQTTIILSPKKVKEVSNPKIKKEKPIHTIKSELYDDILEVELEIYRQMSIPEKLQKAKKAWDILEIMVNKSFEDKLALKKVTNFLSRVDASNLPSGCEGIKMPSKYKKYM